MNTPNPEGKILLVDDETNITDLLNYNLTSEGFSVSVVPNAKDVDLDKIYDCRLVIVDAMAQEPSGITLSEIIKKNPDTSGIPIIVCTSHDSEDVIIDAFDNGAEDFVSKPFSLRELIARIHAILRRHPQKAAAPPAHKEISLPHLGIVIDPDNRKVTIDGELVALSKTEYAILLFLINNRNSFFTRVDICNEVWKEDASSNVRIVDTNISRLRKKMGESGKCIINRYGMGYAFVDKLAQ